MCASTILLSLFHQPDFGIMNLTGERSDFDQFISSIYPIEFLCCLDGMYTSRYKNLFTYACN